MTNGREGLRLTNGREELRLTNGREELSRVVRKRKGSKNVPEACYKKEE